MTTKTDRLINLQRAALCTQCGRELPEGTPARYYSNEKIYCAGEHLESTAVSAVDPKEPNVIGVIDMQIAFWKAMEKTCQAELANLAVDREMF